LYHEVFNEPERDQVLKDVEDWLKTQLSGWGSTKVYRSNHPDDHRDFDRGIDNLKAILEKKMQTLFKEQTGLHFIRFTYSIVTCTYEDPPAAIL
jgi:hypothetical protein